MLKKGEMWQQSVVFSRRGPELDLCSGVCDNDVSLRFPVILTSPPLTFISISPLAVLSTTSTVDTSQ